MLLTVTVTDDDITAGTDGCRDCSVAIATTRALHEAGFTEDWHCEFEPYRMFGKPDGLTFWHYGHGGSGGDTQVAAVPIDKVDGEAYKFASIFDDWFRAETKAEDDYYPDGTPTWDDDEDGEPESVHEDLPVRPCGFTFKVRVPRKVTKSRGQS